MYFSTLLMTLGLAKTGLAAYSLADDYSGGNFFNAFDFYTGGDPTNGYVNYVDQGTAQSQGLINTNGPVYIGVDHTNVASGRGRNSVRLSSKKSYTHMLVVIDLGHMPAGCGTWPAFWSFGPNWPNSGEIDIIEGANDQSVNYMTLHTSASCAIQSVGNALLPAFSQDCNVAVNGNQGCSFHDTDSAFYGTGLNNNNGAIFAMEWTSTGISIWRWAHGSAPGDALADSPSPSNWGPPSAQWGGVGCDWDSHFQNHNLLFDTTFCGDWAGNTFGSCAAANNGQTCQDFVQNNPGAFANAYWSVNALKVYQDNGASQNNVAASPTAKSSAITVSTPVASPSLVAQTTTSKAAVLPPSQTPSSAAPPAQSSPNANSDGALQSGEFGSGSQGIPNSNSNPNNQNSSPPSDDALQSSEFGEGTQGIPSKEASPAGAAKPAQNASPKEGSGTAQETATPLEANEFGEGSQGIPERRAEDMGVGERRRRRHFHRHAGHAGRKH